MAYITWETGALAIGITAVVEFIRGWRGDPDPGVEYWVEPDNQPPPTSAIVR
jgi:hypothetical protein